MPSGDTQDFSTQEEKLQSEQSITEDKPINEALVKNESIDGDQIPTNSNVEGNIDNDISELSTAILEEEEEDDDYDMPSLEDINENPSQTDKKLKKTIQIEDKPELIPKEDGWIDILDSGDFKKRTIVVGEGNNTRPVKGNWVTVKLKGKLANDTVIEDATQKFILGDSDVIQGLDMVIALTQKKEVAEVIIPPRLAYGKQGRDSTIPSNATLHYEIEVLDVEEAQDETELPLNERLKIANEKREKGNFWYSRGEYSNAIHCYRRAIDFLDDDNQNLSNPPEELQTMLDDRLKVYNNLAAAQLKVEAYDAAYKSIENVLKVQPMNVKALFRKGKILSAKGQLDDAIEQMKKALKLEPETKIIHQELSKLMNKKKYEEKIEKAMYKRMFGQEKAKNKPSSKFRNWSLIAGTVLVAVASIAVYRHLHST